MALRRFAIFVVLAICVHSDNATKNIDYTLYRDVEGYLGEIVGKNIVCEDEKAYKFINYINNKTHLFQEEQDWIFPMIDATPIFEFIPPGVLTGNIANYGQFDECMGIGTDRPNNAGINGKYCTFALSIHINEIVFLKSLCIPDTCQLIPSKNEINEIFNISIIINNNYCQTKSINEQLDWDDWTVIGVFIGILIIIAISTIYDVYLHYTETEAKVGNSIFIAFSLVTNCRKLFSTSNVPGQIQCMHGIRAISLMWIIAGHRFVGVSYLPTINFTAMNDFKDSLKSTYITSGRAAVDTFFLFSAFLVSYIYFKGLRNEISKAELKGVSPRNTLTLSRVPIFYLHRLLRILPALTALFFLNITLLDHMGSSPLHSLNFAVLHTCTKWWWSYFLFVQNYVNYKEMCMVPTWYISADMQLFLLSPLLLIPLGELIIRGKKRVAYIVIIVVIWISIVVPMSAEFFREYDKDNIYETHHRASVYTIGILFGMFLIDCTDKKIKISHGLNVLLWILSLGVMLAIILTMHDTEVDPTLEKNNLFFSISRPVWSIALCWIVFSCHFGYGGFINWFLSWPIFQVSTKLSFSMYLLHNIVIYVSIGNVRITRHFSEYSVIYEWCGDYVMTMLASIVWVLCFESPVVCIEKMIFGTGKREKSTSIVEPVNPIKSVSNLV